MNSVLERLRLLRCPLETHVVEDVERFRFELESGGYQVVGRGPMMDYRQTPDPSIGWWNQYGHEGSAEMISIYLYMTGICRVVLGRKGRGRQ